MNQWSSDKADRSFEGFEYSWFEGNKLIYIITQFDKV